MAPNAEELHPARKLLPVDDLEARSLPSCRRRESFDVVLGMEVVERVADVGLYLDRCAAMVRPGGLMFIATINRTAQSFAVAIVGAVYFLRWLRGMCPFDRLVRPEEIVTPLT